MLSAAIEDSKEDGLARPATKHSQSTPEPVVREVKTAGVVTTKPQLASETKPVFSDKPLHGASCIFPFDKEQMSRYLDVENCSWAQLGWGSAIGKAIRLHSLKEGDKVFKSKSFQVKTWNRTYEKKEKSCEADPDGYVSLIYGHIDVPCAATELISKGPHSELHLGFGVHETELNGEKLWVLLQLNASKPYECLPRSWRQSELETSGGWTQNREIFVFVEGLSRSKFIQEWIEEIIKLIPMSPPPKPATREFQIYRWDHCRKRWKMTQTQKGRKMDSVILPEGVIEKVSKDMRAFLAPETAEWYETFGIPYKRSYLFHGVPGSGKTSLICALAGELKRNVCFLAAHHPAFSDDAMKSAMDDLPKNSFLIMEDIDSLFVKRTSQSRKSSLTFTGLLNCLDGIGFARGQIVIMTTNYVDRLDEALVRAGRADMWVEFKAATDYQLSRLFKWFYPKSPEEAEKWVDTFVSGVREKFVRGVTMCELQQHFVDHRAKGPEQCALGIKDYDMPLRKFKHLKTLDFDKDDEEEQPKDDEKEVEVKELPAAESGKENGDTVGKLDSSNSERGSGGETKENGDNIETKTDAKSEDGTIELGSDSCSKEPDCCVM